MGKIFRYRRMYSQEMTGDTEKFQWNQATQANC